MIIRNVKEKKFLTNENKTNEVSNENFTKTNEKTNGVRAFILRINPSNLISLGL